MKLDKLIWSLSPGEKRFFNFLNAKKNTNSASKALKLFQYVDSNSPKNRIDTRTKEYPIDDLARTKHRLNQLVEQSLLFHSSGMFKFQADMLDLLRLAQVYYQKNLYDLSLKAINKGLIKARKEEDFPMILSFLEVLEKVSIRWPKALSQSIEEQFNEINTERNDCLQKIERINRLKKLHSDISSLLPPRFVIDHKKELPHRKKELHDEISSLDLNFLSIKEQIVYLKITQLYYLLIGDIQNCLKETWNSLILIEESLSMDYFLVEDYLNTCQNLILANLWQGDLHLVEQLIYKLSRFKVSTKNKPLLKFQDAIIKISNIRYAYWTMKFNNVLVEVNQLNIPAISGFIHPNHIMEIKFIEIFSNFVLKNFSTTDNLIRTYIAETPKNYIEIDRAGVLILNILVNWELGIRELIPSLCDATRYYFKRIESYQESDRIILSWFKSNLVKRMTPPEFKLKLEELKTNIVKSNLEYSYNFQQVYFSSWIESKLNNVNLADLLGELPIAKS